MLANWTRLAHPSTIARGMDVIALVRDQFENLLDLKEVETEIELWIA